jgi:hypothetical protein
VLIRDPIPSPNYSGRGGTTVRLIVLHTAEGALTYQSLGAFFANPASGVSSHVGIDDTPGVIGEYVPRSGKAWTQGNANPYSVAAELCAFAAWGPAEWAAHPTMLANTAAWLAEEAAVLGIPLVRLSTAQAQDGRSAGVCAHVDLGAAGGGHWDCGPNFPMDAVIAAAAGGPPAQMLHFASGQEDAAMALTTGPDGSRVDLLFVADDSSVHHRWAPNPWELTDPAAGHGDEMLGGVVRAGGGVSGGWTADRQYYVAACEGTDDRVHLNWTTGDGNWSGWHPVGEPGTLR